MEKMKEGYYIPKMRKAVRSIRFPSEIWKELQETAEKNHYTTTQQVLLYVEEGLNNETRPQ